MPVGDPSAETRPGPQSGGVGGGPARRRRSRRPLALLSLFASCAAQPWTVEPRALEGRWQGYEAWEADAVTVLATSRRAARQVHGDTRRVLAALRESGVDPGHGVVLAVAERDAPLAADGLALWSALDRWHAAASGTPSAGAAPLVSSGVDAALLARGVAAGVPGGGAPLELPPADWAAVVPTRYARASVAFALFQAAIGRDRRVAIEFERSHTRLPVARRRIERALGEHARARLCATILAARAPGTGPGACPEPPPAERVDRWLARLTGARLVRRDGQFWLE